MRYRPGFDPVLKDVSFKADSGNKVGIVGRTGAGKSSLLQVLFRLTECDVPPSSIIVGGVNIRDLKLKKLRQSISVIPQSPFIFEGTVRDNLDPFHEYSDTQLWTALEDVELKVYIETFENGLRQHITDGTSFFSVG